MGVSRRPTVDVFPSQLPPSRYHPLELDPDPQKRPGGTVRGRRPRKERRKVWPGICTAGQGASAGQGMVASQLASSWLSGMCEV